MLLCNVILPLFSTRGGVCFSTPLNQRWPCDLLWPREMMLHKFQHLGFKRPSNLHLHPPRTLPPRRPRKETRLPYWITQLTASTRHVTEAILDLPVQLSLHAWVSPGKTNPQNHEKECRHYFKPLNFGVTSFAAIVNTTMLQCGNEVGK